MTESFASASSVITAVKNSWHPGPAADSAVPGAMMLMTGRCGRNASKSSPVRKGIRYSKASSYHSRSSVPTAARNSRHISRLPCSVHQPAKRYRIAQEITDRETKVTAQSVMLEHSKVTCRWLDKEVLTVREAAEYLSVSRKSIYRWAAMGILKPIMLPGAFLISKESLKKMFEDGSRSVIMHLASQRSSQNSRVLR